MSGRMATTGGWHRRVMMLTNQHGANKAALVTWRTQRKVCCDSQGPILLADADQCPIFGSLRSDGPRMGEERVKHHQCGRCGSMHSADYTLRWIKS